jgi:hypothetical protein
MGLTFSLTSFTCTVPFVGSALIALASGEWFYPIVGMLGFATVFAAPFFLLALFPAALMRLPRAGGWMNNLKVVMGFLELAAAVKFLSNADLVWGWGLSRRSYFWRRGWSAERSLRRMSWGCSGFRMIRRWRVWVRFGRWWRSSSAR